MRILTITLLSLITSPFVRAAVDNAATLRFNAHSVNAQLCADLRNPGMKIAELQKVSRSCGKQSVEVSDAAIALLAARAADEFYTYCGQTKCAARFDLDARIYSKQPVARRIREMADRLYEEGKLGQRTAQFIWDRVWLVGPVLATFALKHWSENEIDQGQKNIASVRSFSCAHQSSLSSPDADVSELFEEFLNHVCATK